MSKVQKKKTQPSPINNTNGENSFQKEDFSKCLNEKDVEIEHLKTTIIALDEKSKVNYNRNLYRWLTM